MTTEAQVTANRLNAARSTGPRTAQGQAVVAQNAIKHGVFAHQDVIAGEDPQAYELHRRKLFAELQPVGQIEALLAQRIVSLSWRLQRVERLQNEAFDFLLGKEIEDSLEPYGDLLSPRDQAEIEESPNYNLSLAAGRTVAQDYSEDRVLERLSLHERRIENSLYKAMSQLQSRQLARKGQSADGAPHGLARGNAQAAGRGDRATPSQQDHRQAALDDATRVGPQESATGCAEQTQSPADDDGHSPPCQPGPPEPVADCAKQSQSEGASSAKGQVPGGTDLVKQSQSAAVDGGQNLPSEAPQAELASECAKQSQLPGPAQSDRTPLGRPDDGVCETKPISGPVESQATGTAEPTGCRAKQSQLPVGRLSVGGEAGSLAGVDECQ